MVVASTVGVVGAGVSLGVVVTGVSLGVGVGVVSDNCVRSDIFPFTAPVPL